MSKMELNYGKDNLTQQPYQHYLKRYQETSVFTMSERTGISFSEEESAFFVRFLGELYKVTHPEFTVIHQTETTGIYILEDSIQAKILLLRFFVDGDATTWSGKLLSYHDLPWGEVYYRQFQGRCILRLARTYGNSLVIFKNIMEYMHGLQKDYGDISYEFELMSGLHLCFVLWEGDEEFAPSAQILFSDNFPAEFSAEDVAYVVDIVMDYMKKAGRRIES